MIFQQRIIIWIVSLAVFMETLDTNILNTAIPAMAQSLHVHPIDLKIALISYLLSLAIFIPISGWVADKYGAKRVFINAMMIFTLSSIWCGFAQNLTGLVLARVLQGLGGSLMIPVSRLILLTNFKRHQYIGNMNRVIIVAAFGVMVGPLLGGIITDYLSWHWIFWVNIPMGIITVMLAWFYLPASTPKLVAPLDIVGFMLFGGGLACFTFALSAFSESTIPQFDSLLIFSLAIFLLLGYIGYSKKRTNPVVKVELFQIRTFRISIMGNLLCRLGFGGVPFLLPLLLQIGLHYPPQLSGLLLAPMALGILATKSIAIHLLRLIGYKRLLLSNTVLVSFSLMLFMMIDSHTSVYFIGFMTFLFGLLISFQFSSMNSLAYSEISAENLSAATSIMSTTQQLAQSFGVASVAILLRIIGWSSTTALTTYEFHLTFFILGVFTFFSTGIFFKLKHSDGAEMIKVVEANEDTEVIP